MIEILDEAAEQLKAAGFEIASASDSTHTIVFEGDTVLGLLAAYASTNELIKSWEADQDRFVNERRFQIRAAGKKAWNIYFVMLSSDQVNHHNLISLAAIEEDLRSTRKIARADILDKDDLNNALLPLLPLQARPSLGKVDITQEIRSRTAEIDNTLVDIFLSEADENFVLQIIERMP